MPLKKPCKGESKKDKRKKQSENISKMVHEGKGLKQAIAISFAIMKPKRPDKKK